MKSSKIKLSATLLNFVCRYNSTEKAALGIISAAELALIEDSCQWESVEDKIKKLKG